MAAGTDALSAVIARKPKRRQYEDARERDGQRLDGVTEGGQPIEAVDGVTAVSVDGGNVVVKIGSGNYRFVAKLR